MPPLVHHLDPTCGIRARSLICGLHRPERMVAYGLDVECPHIFMAHTLQDGKIG